MKTRIIFVLIAFIILLTINKISLQSDIKKQNENFTVVNISGKQRMYSQKITKLATYKLENFASPQANNVVLQKAISNFTKDHKVLQNGLATYNNAVLNDLYKELKVSYTNLVGFSNKLLLENIDISKAKSYLKKIRVASSAFLPKMNEIVNKYERIGKDRGELALQREMTFNLVLISLLVYAVLFFIIPVLRSYYKTEKILTT